MLILILHICLTLSRKAQGLGIAFFRCTNTAQRDRGGAYSTLGACALSACSFSEPPNLASLACRAASLLLDPPSRGSLVLIDLSGAW